MALSFEESKRMASKSAMTTSFMAIQNEPVVADVATMDLNDVAAFAAVDSGFTRSDKYVSNGVKDYNDANRTIKIGYAGAGLTAGNLSHVAGYTDNGTKIKDVSKDVLKS